MLRQRRAERLHELSRLVSEEKVTVAVLMNLNDRGDDRLNDVTDAIAHSLLSQNGLTCLSDDSYLDCWFSVISCLTFLNAE